MELRTIVLSGFMTNCFVIYNEESREAVIIDPASSADRIIEKIDKNECKPVAILLTHGHGDHIGAVEDLRKEYGVKVYCHKEEKEVLENPEINLSYMMGENISFSPDILLNDGEVIELAGMKIKVIHTPGHTKGSCCYLFEEYGVLISGDTLFYGSYGRTDFPTGSQATLMRSIKEKLLVLDPGTVVYSGHGSETTIGDEIKWY